MYAGHSKALVCDWYKSYWFFSPPLLALQVTMFLCCALIIAIIQYCTFCQLSFWMRSALATVAGLSLLILLYSASTRTRSDLLSFSHWCKGVHVVYIGVHVVFEFMTCKLCCSFVFCWLSWLFMMILVHRCWRNAPKITEVCLGLFTMNVFSSLWIEVNKRTTMSVIFCIVVNPTGLYIVNW